MRTDDGFVAIRLSVPVFERLTDGQPLLQGGEQQAAEAELGHLVERLGARLGDHAVLQARLVESHLPERAYQLTSTAEMPKGEKPCFLDEVTPPRTARPLHLLPAPREIRVTAAPSLDGEGAPLAFVLDGQPCRVIHAIGPERIAGAWWEGHDKTRDYFDIEDDASRRLWAFRVVQTGKWYLHGAFE